MKIQEYINEHDQYKVDQTYQRPPDAWTKEDKQCLIDTIINGEPMPLFFMNFVSQEGIKYIVDGQQRLGAIKDFYDNKFPLNKKFSGTELHGKTFNSENAISVELRDKFLNYELSTRLLEDYDDERIRMIFSRLQRGKPLQLGERLNAKPGAIVSRMRKIATHPFMQKSIAVHQGRYGNYPDAARILFYEKRGARGMGSNELYNFFDEYRDMDRTDRDYNNAIRVLNFLKKCFLPQEGGYTCLEKHAWVLAVYAMARNLVFRYSITGIENEIKDFVEGFHQKVYDSDWRASSTDIQKFYDNVRGGWSEKIITLRADILTKHCLDKVKPQQLDDKRQIDDAQKLKIYCDRGKCCEHCQKKFGNHREPEYHHIERYADGGPTDPANIEMLCRACHQKAHGKADIAVDISPQEEPDPDD